MEELWNALPSLRLLLDTKPLWETAKKLTWEILSDALLGTVPGNLIIIHSNCSQISTTSGTVPRY